MTITRADSPIYPVRRDRSAFAWRSAALRAVLGDVRTTFLRNAYQGWCAPKPGVPCYELRPSPRSALPKGAKRGHSWRRAWRYPPAAIRGSRLMRRCEISKRKTSRVLRLNDFDWKTGERYATLLV